MIFRHCWECMVEVTPSGRAVVGRYTSMAEVPGERRVLIIPVTPEALSRLCQDGQRWKREEGL